ncbi:MAG: exo-beta-N-acetylmuramidase NamZ family protein [Hyphomicrobiaceae bacterium]
MLFTSRHIAIENLQNFVRAALFTATAMGLTHPAMSQQPSKSRAFATGAERLVASAFAPLKGLRVGLVTNQTGLVNSAHLADMIHQAKGVQLTAILAPEHGFRGAIEAGAKVAGGVDPSTGIPVYSLYGKTRKPTAHMLRNIDVLVFDIQDVGVRFYTYISTMGLAMQAAADAKIPFVVLDRPNPLGGKYVSGFILQPAQHSFVGQYPIPIAHGMTVGELALMIKGEKWLKGLETLELEVIEMSGWNRSMIWPATRRKWVATSPNIPTFESALVYPGTGLVGLTAVNEGRGTPTPFSLIGAPWLDAKALAQRLNKLGRPGVSFHTQSYVPRSIKGVAAHPRFKNTKLTGVRINLTDINAFEPLETGIHILAQLVQEARRVNRARLFTELKMFHLLAGTKDLHRMLKSRKSAKEIIASWQNDISKFKDQRAHYLLYR